ncbi:FAD-binding oxidoreductase [Candidatus Desantisbacteria bacterium CG02_land_8_20_14_3_00_49_13]|nr:MAG: FAD-binding oxidoreductase [Candidatus Desantisbacteria bacterium CG02_land_8_20_14_3_00_49_13]
MIIKKNQDEIIGYLEDSSNFREGKAEKVYIPENEGEIIGIVKECAKNGPKGPTPLTVSAGGTGTVGARIPLEGAVLSIEKLNKIISVDKKGNTAILQAGVMIDNFLKELEKEKLFYPPFPTERTAFIGGNVSTNASGEYSYRFGSTRRYVKRIRVVLSTGTVLDIPRGKYKADKEGYINNGDSPLFFQKGGQSPLKIPSYTSPGVKNSAGYFSRPGMDLIDLFIGSEGTLGIITEVEVEVIPALPPRFIMIMFFPDEERIVPEFLSEVKGRAVVDPLQVEYFDRNSLSFLKKDFPDIPECAAAIYVEDTENEKNLDGWCGLVEKYGIADTWMSKDEKSYRNLVDFRHKLPENVNAYFKKIGSIKLAVDAALPENAFPDFYRMYKKIQDETQIQTVRFGHIGENHLHFNFFPKDAGEKETVARTIEDILRKAVKAGGTVSAEHGIGKLKHRYLEIMYGKEGILEMSRVKKTIDPQSMFGLNNIFPGSMLNI